jgi:DNA-binding response OmpR family regulator
LPGEDATAYRVFMSREERVLVVETNGTIRTAIESGAGDVQIVTDVASDGWDAIEKLRTGRYAAIVIDSNLPRHSGFGVLTYLREENGEEMDNVIMVADDSAAVRRRVSDRLRVVGKVDAVSEIVKVIRARG